MLSTEFVLPGHFTSVLLQRILLMLVIILASSASFAADLDGDGLDASIETCDGNFVPGVYSGSCDTASSCNSNPGCIGTYDFDGDGQSDNVEFANNTDPSNEDNDGDGVLNKLDNCRVDYNPNQEDFDNDGIGDVCDSDTIDSDGDGILDYYDNCDSVANPDQADADNDGLGDYCDPDADPDGDGLQNAYEDSIGTNKLKSDTDSDGINDGMEDVGGTDPNNPDSDNDGVHDGADMYPNNQTRVFSCVPGDANGDGLITTADLILVQQHVMGNNPLSCQ